MVSCDRFKVDSTLSMIETDRDYIRITDSEKGDELLFVYLDKETSGKYEIDRHSERVTFKHGFMKSALNNYGKPLAKDLNFVTMYFGAIKIGTISNIDGVIGFNLNTLVNTFNGHVFSQMDLGINIVVQLNGVMYNVNEIQDLSNMLGTYSTEENNIKIVCGSDSLEGVKFTLGEQGIVI